MRKVIVVPVVIGALGAISLNINEYMKQIGVNLRLEVIQITTLLETAKIQSKLMSPLAEKERDLGPEVTCCNPLPRTINQAEHLA